MKGSGSRTLRLIACWYPFAVKVRKGLPGFCPAVYPPYGGQVPMWSGTLPLVKLDCLSWTSIAAAATGTLDAHLAVRLCKSRARADWARCNSGIAASGSSSTPRVRFHAPQRRAPGIEMLLLQAALGGVFSSSNQKGLGLASWASNGCVVVRDLLDRPEFCVGLGV